MVYLAAEGHTSPPETRTVALTMQAGLVTIQVIQLQTVCAQKRKKWHSKVELPLLIPFPTPECSREHRLYA